jgi:hypothetical protein
MEEGVVCKVEGSPGKVFFEVHLHGSF